ncbi:MAG: adenosylmethionine decarboxylase [Spirochaetes bacterium]|nr:MAG: adenosylmethionine decarboxylase [Spirochaetota bacterium]
MFSLGKHIIADFYECNQELLNNSFLLQEKLSEAAGKSGATVIRSVFHNFTPQGVSGVVVIAESHICIHTWPEFRYAAVDIFTCGDKMDNYMALDLIRDILQAGIYNVFELKRGNFPKKNRGMALKDE